LLEIKQRTVVYFSSSMNKVDFLVPHNLIRYYLTTFPPN
jgi:hypothetical protein